MTEHNAIGTGKAPASERAARGFAAKTARRGPVTAEERERMIATTTYYCAERRGFAPGYELEDWREAVAEIDRRLGRG